MDVVFDCFVKGFFKEAGSVLQLDGKVRTEFWNFVEMHLWFSNKLVNNEVPGQFFHQNFLLFRGSLFSFTIAIAIAITITFRFF